MNQFIRCVSGASLNLFRYATMVLVLLTLGIGNAWASTTYYSRVGVKVASGSGTVYAKGGANSASASSNDVNTTGTSFVYTSEQSSSTQNETKNFAVCAVPATDYRFDKWTFDGTWNSKPTAENASTYGNIKCASSSSGNSATTGTAAATFLQISIASANKPSVTLNPTDARTSCNDYTGTVVFTTTNDNASSQIGAPSFGSKSGSGTWTASNSWTAGASTVTYTFKGNGYYGGSSTASGSRNNSATLTLPTAGGTSSKSVTFTANFPALVIADGETDVVSPKGPKDDGDGAVTFDVTYFDGLFDISSAVISNESGGTWTLGSMSYEQTNAATGAGIVTVPFTFNAGGATGDFSAKLTLTPTANTGASVKEVTLMAHVDDLSTNDASVTPLGGSATEYATFAEALAAANASDGCTLKLLRDVEGITTSQEIKKTMTLDLNRYSLSGTLSAAGGLLKLNTAGKVLTITDTQAGGKISVSGNIDGRISAVDIQKGSLVLAKGDITAQNANTGATEANIYVAGVYLASGTTMSMTGGAITVNRTGASGNYCYGIYGASTSTMSLSNSTITATFANGGYAQGVRTQGNATISNMTISASSRIYSNAIWNANGHVVVNGGIYSGTTSANGARALYSKTAPATTGALVVTNATLNSTAGTTDAKGVYCQSTSATTNGDPTTPNITLSGVTVNAGTEGTTDAYALYTDAGVSMLVNSGTYTASTTTQNAYALHTSGYTAVVNGTFNANATTRTAFAIYVNGGITAVKAGTFTATAATVEVHATKILANAKLLTYGGTFRGVCTNVSADGWATGSQVMSTGTLEAQGGTFIGEIAKTGLGAAQLSYGVGIYANTGSNVSLSSATLRGQTDNTYLNGGHAFYTKTANAVNITNCTLEVSGQYQYGYGIRNNGTPLSVKNSTITINTVYAYNYGIYQEGNTTTDVENTTITCEANSVRAHAIWVSNGQVNATNCSLSAQTNQATATAEAESNLRAVYVSTGKKVTLNGCTVTAKGNANYSTNGYGLYIDGSADIDNTTVTVSNVKTNAYAIGNTSNTTLIEVGSGKFSATAAGGTVVSSTGTAAAAKQQLYGGYYKQKTNLEKYLPIGYGIETLPEGSPERSEGYMYAIRPSTNLNPVCKIGQTPYYTLEEALEFVNKNSSTAYTILMTADYTLPAGDYTLPTNATLLVPKKDQTTLEAHPTRVAKSTAWAAPTCNRKLTFAANANLVVWGKVQTGGVQAAVNQMPGHNGVPRDTYGHIVLNAGSTMILESGSHLYSWGYITGAGAIDAKRGSTVHENLQIRDWRGGTCTGDMNGNSNKVFPLNQYSIQNIEAAITFHPGSAEKCDGTVNARTSLFNSTMKEYTFEDVNLIGVSGSGSLFMMDNEDNSADTWVRKYYDVANDMQVYELNSSANLGSLSLSLYGISFNSVSYVLPLTNNMHIHLLTGTMHITQDTEVLPGAIIEIDKEATAYVDAGKSLYIFDADEWDKFGTGTSYFYLLAYSATLGKAPTARSESTKPADAAFNLHGKLEVEGKLYTTSSGANICSTNEDAGRVHFVNAAPSTTTTVYVANNTGPTYNGKTADPARLKNGDGTYEPTSGTVAGKTWIYTDDKWKCWEVDGCFIRDAQNNPYAHPSDYVRLTNDEPDANHLYKAYESDRYFIWDASCQWWEIDPSLIAAGEYKAIKADHNGKYNYYEYDSTNKYWKIKKVTITWKNGSTTLGTYTNVGYKTHPKYLEATPKINATSTEYYTWLGWTKGSTDGEFFAKDAELPFATENTTYYALFETHKYSYAVVFKNYDGSILQTSPWEAGQVPYYLAETDPVKPATAAKMYSFTGWNPATFSAVTGTGQVYTAQFAESDRTYTVQWVNYNGTVLKEEQVVYGTSPSAPATPTRPNDTYYTYTFDAWTPVISAVSGNQTYTATYNYEKKVTKYDINFKNGNTTIYTQSLPSGETPVYGGSTPTRDDAEYDYTFDGWSATDGGSKLASLPAVSGAANYFAVFTQVKKKYTIRWKSEDGKQLYEMDENVESGTTPTYNSSKPTKAPQGATVFTFDGWSSSVGGAKIALPAVSGDATYYAHFTDDPVYTVTFDANGHGTAPATQEVVQNQLVIKPADPAIAEWIFGGWYKEPGCTNVWNFASDVITADRTLYAKWTQAVATVTANNVTENYTSITDAFTAAKAKTSPTIKLLQDVSMGTATLTYDGANECTLDLNGHEISGTARILFKVDNASAVFTVTDLTESKLGKLSLSTAPTDKAGYCANLVNGTLKLEAGTFYIRSTSTSQNAVGARVDGGEFIMNGGTVHTVVTVNTRVGHGVQPLGTANAIVNGGTVRVESAGQGYGMYVTGTMTVNGGKFHITASSTAEVAHSNASDPTKLFIKGGYYNINTNLAKCVAAPDHVLNMTAAEKVEVGNDYNYKVAEAYNVTFNNYDGTELQSGLVEKGQNPVYTEATPTKSQTDKYSYTFSGWDSEIVAVTKEKTYTAQFSSTPQTYNVTLHTNEGTINSGNVESYTYGEGATLPTNIERVGFDFAGWYDNSELTGDAVTAIPMDAIGDKEYWANWTVTQCTITWKNYDGTPLCDPTIVEWGGEPAYPSHLGTPTRGSDPNLTYTFKDWSPAIHAANGNETYTAQYYMSITTGEPGTYTVSGTEDAVVTTVQVSGALHVPEGNTLTTNDLIVEASSNGSGAIDGIERVTVTGDAYFDYEFNVDPWHWSAFGVPFEIDLNAAAPLKEKTSPLGIVGPDDYDIVYYDTEERAAHGASKNCWKYVDNETHRLIPGRLYMIAFDKHVGHVGVLRFKKAESAPVNYTTSVKLITTGSAGGNNNWNGIANPKMYHALLDAGVTECQVHDGGEIGKDGYYTYNMTDKKFFVGKAAFVQVPQGQDPVVVTPADDGQDPLHAPRRTKAVAADNRYDVQIASTDGAVADRLLILAEEDKADEYVIVSDLAKAGVSPVRAQMWVDRYGEKLCKNTTAYINNKANYPLVISAPTAGEYEIFINELPDNETMLYLTYNGKAIWNLNYSAYAANLEKGTTNSYGLRMVRVPKVGTGIEEATIQNGDAVRKVIVEDKVFIIRNGEMYSITGQKAQ